MFRQAMEFIGEKIIFMKEGGWMGKCMDQGKVNGVTKINK